MYNVGDLRPAGHERGNARVFVHEIHWHVAIVVVTMLTKPKLNQVAVCASGTCSALRLAVSTALGN